VPVRDPRPEEILSVLWIVLSMLLILVVAALVAAYVAYPRRGEEVPAVPWVGDALQRSVEALPTLHNQRR
jgi:hypothetical protein